MMGESAPANNVIVPWNTATGRAEKMQPRPSDAVMVQTMMQSNAPFRASVDQSPSRPSWIDPTMAIELGSRAVDMVDKFELTPREADKLEQEYDEDAANESQDS